MQCPKCGYLMEPTDLECPRCKLMASETHSTPKALKKISIKRHTDGSYKVMESFLVLLVMIGIICGIVLAGVVITFIVVLIVGLFNPSSFLPDVLLIGFLIIVFFAIRAFYRFAKKLLYSWTG